MTWEAFISPGRGGLKSLADNPPRRPGLSVESLSRG